MIIGKAKKGVLVYQYGSPAKCGVITKGPANKPQTYTAHGQNYTMNVNMVLVRWLNGIEGEMSIYNLQDFVDLVETQRTKLARHEERLKKLKTLKELLNL